MTELQTIHGVIGVDDTYRITLHGKQNKIHTPIIQTIGMITNVKPLTVNGSNLIELWQISVTTRLPDDVDEMLMMLRGYSVEHSPIIAHVNFCRDEKIRDNKSLFTQSKFVLSRKSKHLPSWLWYIYTI